MLMDLRERGSVLLPAPCSLLLKALDRRPNMPFFLVIEMLVSMTDERLYRRLQECVNHFEYVLSLLLTSLPLIGAGFILYLPDPS